MPGRRKMALNALISGSAPLADVKRVLAQYPWDSDEDLVVLTRAHVIAMLRRQVSGQLRSDDLREWAEMVESREDVGFEHGCENVVHQAIFELANPDINRQLDGDAVLDWIARLEHVDR